MTKKEPKEKRMADILRASLDEFLEKGYEGASMESIARRAGISKGGLYYHFNSKDEILLHANQEFNKPIMAMMTEASRKSSSAEALSWYIQEFLNFWLDHPKEMVFYSLSIAKLLDHPVLWDMYESYIKKYIKFFQSQYQRGIDSNEFIPHSTYESALILMAALDGIVFSLLMNRELKLDTVVKIYREKYVKAYLGEKPKRKLQENKS